MPFPASRWLWQAWIVSSWEWVRSVPVMQSPIKTYVYPAYGIASLGKVAVEVMLQLYLFDFYTRILGLSPIPVSYTHLTLPTTVIV